MYNDQAEDIAWEKREKLRDAIRELVSSELHYVNEEWRGRGRSAEDFLPTLEADRAAVEKLIREIIPIPGYPDL